MTALATLTLIALASPSAETAQALQDQLDFQHGRVSVAGDKATIDLPSGWSYLQQADARFVVEELWGNPPDPSVVGLIAPPRGENGEDSGWAIIVSYAGDGHVDDGDAAHIDYADLLASLRDDARSENAERRKQGFDTVQILGWAEPPHYDARGKKLYWAKSLQFGRSEERTLNYDVRILGREGVLVMNAVSDVGRLPVVAAGAKEILAVTEFQPGHRYEDYDASTDRLAAYGIGGLIAGKVLVKAGLFKALLLFLAKGWKVLAVACLALAAVSRRLFGGRSEPVLLATQAPVEPGAREDEPAHRDAA